MIITIIALAVVVLSIFALLVLVIIVCNCSYTQKQSIKWALVSCGGGEAPPPQEGVRNQKKISGALRQKYDMF